MVTIFEQRFVGDYNTGTSTCGIMSRKIDGPSNGNGSRPNSGKSGERSSGCFFSNIKSILPCELSKLIAGDSEKTDDLVLIDCQSFMEYSSSHITGALHLNCTGVLKRRLTQGKVKLHDLFSSDQGKERFLQAKDTNRPVIVYDNACSSSEVTTSSKPISLVAKTLLNEGTNTLILQGW
jgi:dual specificity MAP kinase phosphatase